MYEVYAKLAQEQQLQWQVYKGQCMMMVFELYYLQKTKQKSSVILWLQPHTNLETAANTATKFACHSINGYDSIYT
jgi:hypothetical protein